jgi:hypothetical protein
MSLTAGCILRAWEVAKGSSVHRLGLSKPGRNFEPVQCSEDPSKTLGNLHSTTVSTTKSDPARFIAREDSSLTPSDADGSSYLLFGRPTALPGRGQISLAIDATSPTVSARVFFVQDTCLFLEGISFSKESLSRRNLFLEGISFSKEYLVHRSFLGSWARYLRI